MQWDGDMSYLFALLEVDNYLEAPILLRGLFHFYLNNPTKAIPLVVYIIDFELPQIDKYNIYIYIYIHNTVCFITY